MKNTVPVALIAILLAGCGNRGSDLLLAAGEQALVGTYKLDNVLLTPGKLVLLPDGNPLFVGMGDTPEQAGRKGLLEPSQVATLQKDTCTLTVLADHNFTISNLPTADLSQSASSKGNWSIQVYHFSGAHGYRISMKASGSNRDFVRARFFNADKPDPPILEIFYGDGKKESVMFRFARANR